MSGDPSVIEPLWGIRKIRESSEELLSILDRKELYLPAISQMAVESRKQEWLSVRVLLKELLGEEKEIRYTPVGMPYLVDQSYFISITHTRGYVAVILSRQYAVGIDLEYISSRIRKIRNRFMSEEEELHLCSGLEDIHLLLHWSAKESLFKALGQEDVEFRTQLHVLPFTPVINCLSSFSASETRTENRSVYRIYYSVNDDYVLTFCYLCEFPGKYPD